MPPIPEWHALSPADAFARLGSDADGLSPGEAARRLAAHGPNELEEPRRVAALSILAGQFKNALVVVLLVAVGLSALLGHTVEAIAIAVILLLAVLLGFVQEYRAEHVLAALRRLVAPNATVVRQGREVELPAREVVPGDVLLLHAGDKVPCDALLVEAVNLQADEAALTGESLPVDKVVGPLPRGPTVAVGDRKNTVFGGTALTRGRGRGVVVETGRHTEFGRIAQLVESVEPVRTPLQVSLDRVGHALVRGALAIVALVVALGVVRGQPLLELLVFGVALAVAVVPEALPAVVTISLALGVQRLARRKALVRRLAAAETLGTTSVICSDKTGTLTMDEMTARAVYVDGQRLTVSGHGYEPEGAFLADGVVVAVSDALRQLLAAAALASDAQIESGASGWRVRGDPTEGALVVAAAKAGLRKADLDGRWPRVAELPFTSERKRMTTLHHVEGDVVAYTKGAPEEVIGLCRRILGASGERVCSDADREHLQEVARCMAAEALRVIAVARRSGATVADAERDLTFLGLVGMLDPPRPEARSAIQRCVESGVKVVMITGDHPATARAIAIELGLAGTHLLTGAALDGIGDEELERMVAEVEVYARVSPAHKLRIVTALQRRGHVVAMTGDGINDAPALRKADLGIAMGRTGTDVAREAAAMTLTDDNFATIVRAIEEGRGIYANVRKYLTYLLASNAGEIGVVAGASLLGLPLPLSAVQILYVNLATDGLPALALAVDPPEDDLMRRAPRDPRRGILDRPVLTSIVVAGAWSALLNVGLFAWALASGRGEAEAMTMAFVSLVLVQFINAYVFRSERHTLLHRFFENRWLNAAIAWELALLAAVVYLPVLRRPFGTFALPVEDWIVVGLAAVTMAPVLETAKAWARKRWPARGRSPAVLVER